MGAPSPARAAILIHGPTASGKTRLAIELARRLDGEIINADAMQVYADLKVLTARPTDAEMAEAPHRLYGHVDAATRYSAGRWLKEARSAIEAVRAAGRTPIVVGGTGLYLMSLTEGLADIPAIPEAAREEARALVADNAAAAWRRLREIDPQSAARIAPADRQRVARALEVHLATGRPLSSFHAATPAALGPDEQLGVVLTPPRETVYASVDARLAGMIRNGAAAEAEALWRRKLDRESPAMRAHGAPGFCDYFDGRITLEEAIERARRDTRRYAKRQMTWIAHQFTLWPRLPSLDLQVRARAIAVLWETLMRRRAQASAAQASPAQASPAQPAAAGPD